uniref:Bestrophin homolog n=1 Tax=Elaeophora elaphi TaxID=1147741 RepID=A0A0R3S7B4_9BILA
MQIRPINAFVFDIFRLASNQEFFKDVKVPQLRETSHRNITFQSIRALTNNIWRAFWPVTNVLWVGYIVDCIYHRLERSRISCSLARRAFLNHFKHLHGYANLWTWVRDHIGTHMKREIVEVRGTQQP